MRINANTLAHLILCVPPVPFPNDRVFIYKSIASLTSVSIHHCYPLPSFSRSERPKTSFFIKAAHQDPVSEQRVFGQDGIQKQGSCLDRVNLIITSHNSWCLSVHQTERFFNPTATAGLFWSDQLRTFFSRQSSVLMGTERSHYIDYRRSNKAIFRMSFIVR